MMQDKFKEIVQARLTQDDIMELFETIIAPLIEETGKQVVASVRATALQSRNIYAANYGELFPIPLENGDIVKIVTQKIIEQYNALPDRMFDITLLEREV